MLADRQACGGRGDGLKRTANLGWRRRLEIPHVDVRWPAEQVDQDAGACPTKSRRRLIAVQQLRAVPLASTSPPPMRRNPRRSIVASERGKSLGMTRVAAGEIGLLAGRGDRLSE